MIRDERSLKMGRHLNDLRDCKLEFSGDEWFDAIRNVLEKMPAHAPWTAAIVTNNAVTYATVRQFLGYARKPGQEMKCQRKPLYRKRIDGWSGVEYPRSYPESPAAAH